ncbi:MAG: hydroxyacid dehydrogenase [Treponema sp.]|nr:hydroxyacid dehydrogenase [Treponema sp.]
MEERDIGEIPLAELLARYPPRDSPGEKERIETLLAGGLKKNTRKIIVLDDDPTGVQTVHGVSVYTGWDAASIEAGFEEPGPLFFILTNSRGLTAEESARVHAEIGKTICAGAAKKNRDFIIISRSDSTLRGHYPLETQVLRRVIEEESGRVFDGEIICPFFKEGGRYTAENIHYVLMGEKLLPAAGTEFARDKTFGYAHSDLCSWVEEKTAGEFSRDRIISLSLRELRSPGADAAVGALTEKLLKVRNFDKVILNALDYRDVRIFGAAFFQALDRGKRFLIRSAAALPKVLGGIPDRPLLTREDLIHGTNRRGGLIVIGSHVQKTTRQLERLLEDCPAEAVMFDTHLVTDEDKFTKETERVRRLANDALETGKTTVIFTNRKRFDLNTGDKEDELRVAKKIAAAVTSFVSTLRGKPRFIIAKGGITSSEIGTLALGVKKALVLGQVLPGIPVWLTGPESRFPNMPYIIFPGNVGDEDSLKEIAAMLAETQGGA